MVCLTLLFYKSEQVTHNTLCPHCCNLSQDNTSKTELVWNIVLWRQHDESSIPQDPETNVLFLAGCRNLWIVAHFLLWILSVSALLTFPFPTHLFQTMLISADSIRLTLMTWKITKVNWDQLVSATPLHTTGCTFICCLHGLTCSGSWRAGVYWQPAPRSGRPVDDRAHMETGNSFTHIHRLRHGHVAVEDHEKWGPWSIVKHDLMVRELLLTFEASILVVAVKCQFSKQTLKIPAWNRSESPDSARSKIHH